MGGERIFVRVQGRVQGVGYRYFVCYLAKRFQVTGWVKNTPEGEVEIEVQGLGENRLKFLEALRKGPPLCRVDQLDLSELEEQPGESGFKIAY